MSTDIPLPSRSSTDNSSPLIASDLIVARSDQDNQVTSAAGRALANRPQTSQIKWPIIFTVIAVGALIAFLVTNPIGWGFTALGIAALIGGLGLIIGANALNYMQKSKLDRQKMSFEVTTILRMLPFVTNYNEIPLEGLKLDDGTNIPNTAKLYVGALPNKNSPGNTIPPNVKAVVSNNQDFEFEPLGPSDPLTKADWQSRGAEYLRNETEDHLPVAPKLMDAAADFMIPAIRKGEAVLSHCRGGVGRSATSAAALMMKHFRDQDGNPLSIPEICVRIKTGRKNSTPWYKLHALRDYDEYLKAQGVARPKRTAKFDALADRLKQMEEARLEGTSKQTPKISEADIATLY